MVRDNNNMSARLAKKTLKAETVNPKPKIPKRHAQKPHTLNPKLQNPKPQSTKNLNPKAAVSSTPTPSTHKPPNPTPWTTLTLGLLYEHAREISTVRSRASPAGLLLLTMLVPNFLDDVQQVRRHRITEAYLMLALLHHRILTHELRWRSNSK